MSVSTARRPLPALAFLLALSVLTSIVWWRVLHRPSDEAAAGVKARTSQQANCTPKGAAVKLPAPAAVSVQVLNSTDRAGIATAASAALRARGFAIAAKPDDTSPTLNGIADIRYGKSGTVGATLLSYYLPGAKLVAASRPDARIDVVLGQAFSAIAAPATVTRAIAIARKPC